MRKFPSIDTQVIRPIGLREQTDSRSTSSNTALHEMRLSQYRQRIEMLEATLRESVAKQEAMEKLVERMQIRISATENHCSWTTDQFSGLGQRFQPFVPSQSLKSRLKARLLYPLTRHGLRLLSAVMRFAPGAREAAVFKLFRDKRAVYDKCKQLSPALFQALEAQTTLAPWRALIDGEARDLRVAQRLVEPLCDVPNTRLVVDGNPALASLPRPLASVLEEKNRSTQRQDELLKEVTRLEQVRRGAASVAFVVRVEAHEAQSLDQTLQSVFRQTDPSWELLLCAGEGAHALVAEWLDRDWRIRRVPTQVNQVHALIRSAQIATSRFVGLLSPGDVVDDDLVKKIGQMASRDPHLAAIYTDQARLDPNGNVVHPFYKPSWSPEHQLSTNMLGRFLAFEKPLLLNLPVQAWFDSSMAEYLLSLRLVGQSLAVGHLDEVMYLRGNSAPEDERVIGGRFSAQQLKAARPDMQGYLREELDPHASVEADESAGAFRVHWSIPTDTPVTLVILTNMRYRQVERRGNILMALNFVKSIIEKSTYPNYKIVVVDDGYVPQELSELLAKHGHSSQTYRAEGAFSFSGKSNFASSLATSGVVVLLNDDLEVIAKDWIEALVEQVLRPEVGVVGGKLLFPDGSVQHAGISIGLNGSAGHVFMGRPQDEPEYGGYASVIRNYGAVTGALMAYRKEFFDQMGGFDEFFRVDYNDIDFCLRCVAKGYRVVYTPYARLYHFHNSSFNRQHDLAHERAEFLRRWQHLVELDPYCGVHLAPICREGAHQDD